MFKFGFSNDDNEKAEEENNEEDICWKSSTEINPKILDNLDNLIDECEVHTVSIGDFTIEYISSIDVIIKLIRDSDGVSSDVILKAEENHSDLLVGQYEGGLKIWECTFDMLEFMKELNPSLDEKKVLDLGCGVGIVGILATKHGASCYFQDYNREVLEYVTIPNLVINNKADSDKCIRRQKYFSGDWESFSTLLKDDCSDEKNKFDYIFTCETIYNPKNYRKLHDVFKNLLKQQGVIYLGAKSYYFGVGGGLSDFKDFMSKQNIFKFKTVWKYSNGLEREILEIKFKS